MTTPMPDPTAIAERITARIEALPWGHPSLTHEARLVLVKLACHEYAELVIAGIQKEFAK